MEGGKVLISSKDKYEEDKDRRETGTQDTESNFSQNLDRPTPTLVSCITTFQVRQIDSLLIRLVLTEHFLPGIKAAENTGGLVCSPRSLVVWGFSKCQKQNKIKF